MKGALGILGGMGPLATVDFMQKVIEATSAERDQDHIPILVHAVPQVPDRTESILAGNDEPLEWMRRGADILRNGGAECIAIPCNTAHYWHENLVSGLSIPVLHIVDATAQALVANDITDGAIGLLATTGTITAGIYQDRLEALGYKCLYPNEATQTNGVMAGIDAVKAGNFDTGRKRLETAAITLVERGCRAIVLGCTEIPIVLTADMTPAPSINFLDATNALARAAVNWHRRVTGKT